MVPLHSVLSVSVLGFTVLLPALGAQEEVRRSHYERLLPDQPFLELCIENPAKLWSDLVKSRMGRVLSSGSLDELHLAWKESRELKMFQERLVTWLGLDSESSSDFLSILREVKGSLRVAYLVQHKYQAWVLEVKGELPQLERIKKILTVGFGLAQPTKANAELELFGTKTALLQQRHGDWRYVAPFQAEDSLYFAAWLPKDEASASSPWTREVRERRMVRSLLQRSRMPLQVTVDLRPYMSRLREDWKNGRVVDSPWSYLSLFLGRATDLPDLEVLRLGLDAKRGRIVQELRAQVKEEGVLAGFLGAMIPREGKAVDLIALQPKGVRSSYLISVDAQKTWAEFERLFKKGSREMGGREIDIEATCEAQFGISMKNDMIQPLDGTLLFFEGKNKKGKGTGACIGFGSTDPKKTGETVMKMFEEPGMSGKESEDYRGFTIHKFAIPFFFSKIQIRYAITNRFFLMAFKDAGHDYLRQILDREKAAEEGRIRPAGDLKAQLRLVSQQSATLAWADTIVAMTSFLDQWAARLAKHPAEEPTLDVSSRTHKTLSESLVPLLQKEGLTTTLSALGRDRHGFWIRWIW